MRLKHVFSFTALVLAAVMVCALFLGCSPALENPYKGKDVVVEVTKAELVDSAKTPEGTLGDKEHFVARIAMNVYNIVPTDMGDKKDDTTRVKDTLKSSLACIEAKDYTAECAAADWSGFVYSKDSAVANGAVLYYLVPVKNLNDPLRFAVYNTTGGADRKVLFETSEFDKSGLTAKVDASASASPDNSVTASSSPEKTASPEASEQAGGIVYEGNADFESAEKFFIRCTLSEDLSSITSAEIQINNLKFTKTDGATQTTVNVGQTSVKSSKATPVKDNKAIIDLGDIKLKLAVLDSCLYGTVSYTFKPQNTGDKPIDLGTFDAILKNTNGGAVPDDIDELLNQFKQENQ